MQRFNNTYSNSVSPMTSRQQMMQNPGDWGAEISGSAAGMSMSQGYPEQRMGQGGMAPSNSAPMVAQGGGSTTLDMSNNQQEDVIMAPTTMAAQSGQLCSGNISGGHPVHGFLGGNLV